VKTIFDEATRDEVIQRIASLDERSAANWGKMNISQMLRHCALYEEMILRGHNQRQTLVGRIVGKRVLRDFIKDERPIKRNLPTLAQLRVSESGGDINLLKDRWISLIREFGRYSEPHFTHPFFGTMTKEQVGRLGYKHTDHHLRQFGA
jgi:Protein of unknown function (DUF1569)